MSRGVIRDISFSAKNGSMWLRRSEATVRRCDFLRPRTSSRRLSSIPASAMVARSLRGGETLARSSRSRFSACAFVSPSRSPGVRAVPTLRWIFLPSGPYQDPIQERPTSRSDPVP